MDDALALIAREVAMAASAWHKCASDTEAYRRLIQAVETWDHYLTPALINPVSEDIAAQVRKAARQAVYALDEEMVEHAGALAIVASRWLHTPTSHEAYRGFIAAIDTWDNYTAPHFEADVHELLDELGTDTEPMPLGALISGALQPPRAPSEPVHDSGPADTRSSTN
jgi:hypothetical protein